MPAVLRSPDPIPPLLPKPYEHLCVCGRGCSALTHLGQVQEAAEGLAEIAGREDAPEGLAWEALQALLAAAADAAAVGSAGGPESAAVAVEGMWACVQALQARLPGSAAPTLAFLQALYEAAQVGAAGTAARGTLAC
jgi:hypothetical protein